MPSSKARASSPSSILCLPAPASPATTTAWRPRSRLDQLSLTAARHPLLERHLRATGGHVVPLTLELTTDARQLIISGPNTGGKTVTLKTTALLAMMAQAGLPVPAAAASFPIFTAFLADIGDAQSIEAELSTFSAHIVNLNRLSRLADRALPCPARRARLRHRS